MSTIREKVWSPSVSLSPVAVANSVITVADTTGLHPKQIVDLFDGAGNTSQFEIKRILSNVLLQIGPVGSSINEISNPVAFNGGSLSMSEQGRNAMEWQYVLRNVYLEEPAVALRNILVDQYGEYFSSAVDSLGARRLAVDAERVTTSSDLIRNNYVTSPITTAAYIEVLAATSVDIKMLEIYDGSSSIMVLAIGPVGFEIDILYIIPGGNGQVKYTIPAGTRLSVKAVSANAINGELVINAYSIA